MDEEGADYSCRLGRVTFVALHTKRHPILYTIVVILTVVVMASPYPALNSFCQARPGLSVDPGEVSDLLLEPGKTVNCKLSSGQTRSFQINLKPAQCLPVLVDHWGVDLNVAWHGPGSQKITELACRRTEPTPVTLIAEVLGTYRLELRAPDKYPAQGNCEVTVEALRVANAKDKKCIFAEQAASEAERLRWEWKEELAKRAIKKYEEAVTFWRSCGERRQESVALRFVGEILLGLGRSQEAVNCFHQALQISETLNDLRGEGRTLNNLGIAYYHLDENQKALDFLNRALKLRQLVADRRIEAQALSNLSDIYRHFGDISKSLNFGQQALFLCQSLGDPRGQAVALQSLGFAYYNQNDNSKALESFKQAFDLWRATGDRRGQALTLLGLGHVNSLMGEKQEALNLYGQAKPLIELMGDHYWEVGLVNGLAILYDELGETQKALEYYQQALQLNRAVSSREGEATDLWKIGRIYFSLGNKPQALACLQLALKTFTAVAHQIGISTALRDIGTVYASSGKDKEALEYYNQALELNKKGGFKRQEAITLNDIGHVYWKLGDEQKALDHYKQALLLHRAAMNFLGESLTLYNLAVLERNRGNLTEARSQLEAALKVVESLRGKVVSQELRSSYFASEHQRYDFYIDLLMQMHKEYRSEELAADALQASERAHSRSLLEILVEGRADIRQGVEPALLERERSLRQSLNQKADHRMRLGGDKPDETKRAELDKEISGLELEYEDVEAQIRVRSPRYAALTQPQPLTAREIQQQVLDDDTLLLEYDLGEERSFLWAVAPTSISSYELPKRTKIEIAARRVYDLLLARQAKTAETITARSARVNDTDTKYWQEATLLSQMLLGPVAKQLGTKRLLIVTEGALQYLPFSALPKPGQGAGEEGGRIIGPLGKTGTDAPIPLILEHEIVSLPSASSLAILRRETRNRPAPAKMVVVFADPVFEADDPRVKRKSPSLPKLGKVDSLKQSPALNPKTSHLLTPAPRRTSSPAASATLSAVQGTPRGVGRLRSGLNLSRLVSSRLEAEAILAMIPAGAGMKAVNFEASRATVTSLELSQYRIVHFATHGLFDTEHPELSGLVLSMVDEQGQPQNGFLGLHDIYNLNLSADLVVLSACNTGLGREIRGEGLVGIVRGFMYAGAKRVVASLWKVDDEAAAELMKRFYQRMITGGMSAAAALRSAQMDLQHQKRWSSPYYWAAFVLQGEWN